MTADIPNFSKLRVAISVSESADLQRLGFSEAHLRLVLGEIARTVLVHGGSLIYGGHLLPTGYTTFLVRELERYRHPDRPLQICLPWSEHATLDFEALEKRKRAYGLYALVTCLDIHGVEVQRVNGQALQNELSHEERVQSLSAMRRFVANSCDCRILIGGKLRDYQGAIPGVIEEAVLALRSSTPLLLAGGFGGATAEILRAIDPHFVEWFPPSAERRWEPTLPDQNALAEIQKLWRRNEGQYFKYLGKEQMQTLAATHRPSEVATLVGQALTKMGRSVSKKIKIKKATRKP